MLSSYRHLIQFLSRWLLIKTFVRISLCHSVPYASHHLLPVIPHTPVYPVPLRTTPFHALGHAWCGLGCVAWQVLQPLWPYIFTKHSCANYEDMSHFSCVQYFDQHCACIIPFNPHKALKCAYLVSSLCRWGNWHTQWLSDMHLITD